MTDKTDAEPGDVATPELVTSSKRRWSIWLGGILLALIAWNAVVTVPVMRALSDEEGSTTVVYRRWLVSPDQIVFDVRKIDETQSMVAMDRRLFKAAEALQGRSFDSVVLAYHGKTKFLMDGPYFQEIGATRQSQNPVYTIRTMQEKLQNPDGTPAFDTWSGGLLGVLGKQMEDHNTFHKRWWVNEELGLPSDSSL